MRPVGYYVHHQGAGHRQRACAVASRLARPCTLLGTADAASLTGAPGPVLWLPDDRVDAGFRGEDGETGRPLAFHYAPLGHAGIRDRMCAIARWVAEARPVLMVVDVSVEVALFARLLSVPTIVVRLAGDRTDPAHLEAFRSADMLVAPFPEELEAPETPAWVKSKTRYAGLLAVGTPGRRAPSSLEDDGRIVVVLGRGGGERPLEDLVSAAEAVPERAWHVLGDVAGGSAPLPANLYLHGWIADAGEHAARAGIVVGAAGDGVLGLVASLRKRFVCLPEARAYDEQASKGRALRGLGAAVLLDAWPTDRWPSVIAEASSLDPAIIGRMARPDGIGWVAREIEAAATRIEARSGSKDPVVR